MIQRHTDAVRINEIMNADGIRDAFDVPSMEGQYLDFSGFISNPENYGLVGEHGCCTLRKHQAGIYECHFSVFPEHRGEWTLEFAWEVFEYMFCETDAYEIMTKCKVNDLASNAGARSVKFEPMFTTRKFCEDSSGPVAMNAYSLTIQKWVTIAPGLVEAGEKWHEIIEAVHEEDEVHNRYAGLAYLMIKGGQPIKALNFYNRAAVMSGYRPCSLVSVEPLVVDVIEAKILITGRNFEVVP